MVEPHKRPTYRHATKTHAEVRCRVTLLPISDSLVKSLFSVVVEGRAASLLEKRNVRRRSTCSFLS